MKPPPLLYIEWEDAGVLDTSNGLYSMPEAIAESAPGHFLMFQVGRLIFEGDGYILLAAGGRVDSSEFDGLIRIPKSLIKKRRRIGEPNGNK